MKTISKVNVNVVLCEIIPENIEDNTIYISHKYKTAAHNCLCGCKNLSVTPFNMWNITEKNGKYSFVPSILNTNCPNQSHYVITNNIANIL